MRQIIWNKLAKEDYFNNIDYLLEKWSDKEAQKFVNQVDEILFILTQGELISRKQIILSSNVVLFAIKSLFFIRL